MIDEIVEMILKEARASNIKDVCSAIHSVDNKVSIKLLEIMDKYREEERRLKGNED